MWHAGGIATGEKKPKFVEKFLTHCQSDHHSFLIHNSEVAPDIQRRV
jgi:hypothetical protein